MPPTSRVCDRCIRKKVKCDLQRPQCSRCSEASCPCEYSREKRKPGPSRGARPRHRLPIAAKPSLNDSHDGQVIIDNLLAEGSLQSHPSDKPISFDGASTSKQSMLSLDELNADFSQYPTLTIPTSGFPGYHLDPSQERNLLLQFFDDVHPAIPMFQQGKFLKLYDDGVATSDLVITMATITAKVLGPINFWRQEDIDLCMSTLLASTAYESDSASSQVSLDLLRQGCLLAYYEFHQFPGPSAWMRISRLTRKAYAMGLNQIENPDLCSAYDAELASEDEIEDWRYVWWCLYCLDSYSNISLGAPFVVDLESINTALVRRSTTDDGAPESPKLFLPDEVDQLWRTAQDVVLNRFTREFNIHIVTTTILRQAGNLLRLRMMKKPVNHKTEVLKSNLASLRLALPPRYLNPVRNVLIDELGLQHHARLTNMMHLHMTRLLINLPHDIQADEAEWLDCWQQTLEACQDIVSVVEQWNNQYSPRVDPAICIIAFVALWITNLHRRCIVDATSPLLPSLAQAENILLLFLEQFSMMWALPKMLIHTFKTSPSNDPLTYLDVDRMVRQLKMPLHPKTFHQAYAVSLGTPDLFGGFDIGTGFVNSLPFSI